MSYVDLLRENRESPRVPLLEFLQQQQPHTLHMFVEGDGDAAFYRNFVFQYYKDADSLYVYDCGGKDSVYAVRKSIYSRDNQPEWADSMTLLFFVDKDLSDILQKHYNQETNIFVTDFYSVENY